MVVGQSLAPGVDAPPGPVDAGLASRLGDVLRPIRERHLNSWAGLRISCTVGHGVKKLYSFSARCLGGGLRAQRLLDVVCGAEQGTALCALDFVVNITESRKVPRSLSMHLTGDSLVDRAQEIAGARLIAASKVSCQFTSKCLCSAFCSDAQRFFWFTSCGCG